MTFTHEGRGVGHRGKVRNQKELVELILRLPYCRVADVVQAQIAKRQTATVDLQTLAKAGLLSK